MHRTDAPGNLAGVFTEGNPYGSPATGGTVVSSDWLNDVQENIAGAIEGAGLALAKGNYGQLQAAIRRLALDSYFRGREMRAQARVAQSTLDVAGLPAATELGTISNGTVVDGPYSQATTANAASVPEDIGWKWTFAEVQRRWDLDLELSVAVVSISHSRLWAGVFSADPSALQDPTTISCAAFRFDATLDDVASGGDGTIKSVTAAAAGSSVKSTGVVYVPGTRYRMRVRHSPDVNGRFEFYLDGVPVTTHEGTAEHVPTSTTALGPAVLVRHLSDASNKQVRLGWLVLRSK